MKLLKSLFLATTLFFISCQEELLTDRIVGTWNLLSVESTGCNDPADNLPLVTPDNNGCITFQSDILCNIFLTFSTDGSAVETLTEENEQDTEDYTYTTNDDNETASLCESASDCQTLTFDGNVLTRTIIDGGCTTVVKYEKV